MIIRSLLYISLLLLLSFSSFAQVEKSVLAEGQFFKMPIAKDGVYKISGNQLEALGIPLPIPSNFIHIYGNPGGMLPQANDEERPFGLIQHAIQINDNRDGSFDQNDFLLFFAEGVDKVIANRSEVFKETNLYTETNYYFLGINDDEALRVENESIIVNNINEVTASFIDFYTHEQELTKDMMNDPSGREWYGEKFDINTEQSFTVSTPSRDISSDVNLSIVVLAKSTTPSFFEVLVNGSVIDTIQINKINGGVYDLQASKNVKDIVIPSQRLNNQESFDLTLRYSKTSPESVGYLDKFSINWNRVFEYNSTNILFHIPGSTDRLDARGWKEGIQVWDVSSFGKAINKRVEISNNLFSVFFDKEEDTLTKGVLFHPNEVESIQQFIPISNQNLYSLSSLDFLIITPESFVSAAQRLANHRQSHDNLKVEVVELEKIYNDFSSGRPDVTAIRDYIKYLYDKPTGLKYVLFFGDGSFDYKDRFFDNTNKIPTYQSRESLHPIRSYCSDDYFGFLDDDEGFWPESGINEMEHDMEIGIGRIPANTLGEADNFVDKLINYDTSPSRFGNWRSRVTFVGDDGDNNIHQRDADRLGKMVESNFPDFQVKRLFIDNYPKVSTPSKKESPEVREKINSIIENEGTLILNYSGHGAETVWAEEDILNNSQILGWNNLDKLPLIVAATCEFGRFDDPRRVSGAEYALFNKNGGAVAMLVTSRLVYQSTNYALNNAFYSTVFQKVKGKNQRLGDIMKTTKNNSINGTNNRNFVLLGDPSMQLAYPEANIELTSLLDKNGAAIDTISALQKITLKGAIKNQESILQGFEGIVAITLYDKIDQVSTLGNEGERYVYQYEDYETVLFRGSASVSNGVFELPITIPKDIKYESGNGRFFFYAYDEANGLDAVGGINDIVIGGSSDMLLDDTTPPIIDAYLQSSSFKNGDILPSSTMLYLHLSDESGINISNVGLGHDLMATIEGPTSQSIVLNNYYKATLNKPNEGFLSYPINNLEEGSYSITISAWDNYNNLTRKTLFFSVSKSLDNSITETLVFPNPCKGECTLQVSHTFEEEVTQFDLSIFNSLGRAIFQESGSSNSTNAAISLYLSSEKLKGLDNGLYFYKVSLSQENQGSNSVVGKFFFLR